LDNKTLDQQMKSCYIPPLAGEWAFIRRLREGLTREADGDSLSMRHENG
jgi:hypothetical protein